MSQENVEVVRRIWQLWTEGLETGDAGALPAAYDEGLLAPDSTFTPVQDVPGASERTYVGLDGLREFLRVWTEDWTEWSVAVEQVIDAGDDRVIAVARQSAVGKGSRVPVNLRFGMVFTLRNGQVIDRRDYRDPAAALEASGLPG